MKFKSILTILILILGLVIPASLLRAQDPDPDLLTLDRIFRNREFRPERFGPTRWLADGTGYTTLERADSGTRSRDIVKYDPKTGKREVLVSAKELSSGARICFKRRGGGRGAAAIASGLQGVEVPLWQIFLPYIKNV